VNRSMIVSPQRAAAEEGREVLRRGGNAIDAAVTCAFIQGVVDPQMCGIGGCGVLTVYQAKEDRVTILEFYCRAGSKVQPDQWEHLFIQEKADRYGYVLKGWINDCGYQSVGVPGTVAGLDEALRRFGTISWDQAIRPAVKYAREGFAVTADLHATWTTDYGREEVPMWRRLQWTEASKRIYTKDGSLFAMGEVLQNEDLSRTLERLATAGARDFYEGELAQVIAEDLERNGGSITLQDLASYRVRVGNPAQGDYRGWTVVAPGPPAGGVTLLQLLNYLEGYDVAALGWPSAGGALARVRAMDFAFEDRQRYLADPAFAQVPVEKLNDKQYAAAARVAHDSPTTTQVCVVDGEGNAVSLTHTLGASSGVVTPGLGFTYNNYLNCFDPRPGRVNSLAQGKTRLTMMVPTLVFRDGRLRLVLGAPGGTKIVMGVLHTLLNVIDHDMTPEEAVAAPRVDFQGEVVQAEQRITTDILEAIQAGGYQVNRRPYGYDPTFSRVQLIEIGLSGELRGASDPRKDGGIALDSGRENEG
jgi:gamma-glutamyltranspeptidase/glutathione hydrolase